MLYLYGMASFLPYTETDKLLIDLADRVIWYLQSDTSNIGWSAHMDHLTASSGQPTQRTIGSKNHPVIGVKYVR